MDSLTSQLPVISLKFIGKFVILDSAAIDSGSGEPQSLGPVPFPEITISLRHFTIR